jgi:hypothetical protein
MFDCDGEWIASPGPYEGLSFQPEFAPIKAIEWDSLNVRPMLNAIDVAWTNLFIPEDNRVILLDKAYKDDLLSNLIGIPGTTPATDKAYDALVEGRFERFYGWDFDFSIPSQYYPKVWLDANNNVVHSATGTAAFDMVMNSISAPDGVLKLQNELSEATRVRATNYIGTYFDNNTKKFKNVVTNYPLAMPSSVPYYGVPVEKQETYNDSTHAYVQPVDWSVPGGQPTDNGFEDLTQQTFPWQGYPGQGIPAPSGPVGPIVRRQVIGMAVYRPAAQLGEEYGAMETDRGKTRGKFTELVFDVKHDAWVIPQYSHGILLIVDSQENVGTPTIKVENVTNPTGEPTITSISVSPTEVDEVPVGSRIWPSVTIEGTGSFDKGWTATSSNTSVATVSPDGVITVVGNGMATITFTSVGDNSKTATMTVGHTSA